jgi:hypothetical protein
LLRAAITVEAPPENYADHFGPRFAFLDISRSSRAEMSIGKKSFVLAIKKW